MTCDALASFTKMLHKIQTRYSSSEASSKNPHIQKFAEKIKKLDICEWIQCDTFLKLEFFHYLFKDFKKNVIRLNAEEVEIFKKANLSSFIDSFVLSFNNCFKINNLAESLSNLYKVLGLDLGSEEVKSLVKRNQQIQKKFKNGEVKLASEIRKIFNDFGYLDAQKSNSSVVEFLSHFCNHEDSEFLEFVSLSALPENLTDRITDLVENSTSKNKKDIEVLLSLKTYFEGAVLIRSSESLKAFTETQPNDLIQKMNESLHKIKDNLKLLKKVFEEKKEKSKDRKEAKKRTFSMTKIIKSFFEKFSVNFKIVIRLKQVEIQIIKNDEDFEYGDFEFSFDNLLEIKYKAKIFLENKIYNSEKKIKKCNLFMNTMEAISNYKTTLEKCLKKGFLPQKDYLIPLKINKVYRSPMELSSIYLENLKISNLKVLQIWEIDNLSQKLEVLEFKILNFQSLRSSFLKSEVENWNCVANIYLEKGLFELSKQNTRHFFRSIGFEPSNKKFDKIYQKISQEKKEKGTQNDEVFLFQKLNKAIKENKESLENHFRNEASDKNLDMSVKYIQVSSKHKFSQWRLLNMYNDQVQGGEYQPYTNFFFCSSRTSFEQLEPFLNRAFAIKTKKAYVVMGFVFLKSETQKKCLDFFKNRFDDRQEDVHLLLFLEDSDSCERLLKNNDQLFEECKIPDLKKTPEKLESPTVQGSSLACLIISI